MNERHGFVYGLAEEKYHGDPHSLSSTGAKLLATKTPAHYRAYLDGEQRRSRALDVGSLAHAFILGQSHAYAPKQFDGRTKDGRAEKEMAQAEGVILVSAEDYASAEAMAQAVWADPLACDLLGRCEAFEVSMYATDPVTGVTMRGRADGLGPEDIVDVKTSRSADPADLDKIAYDFSWGQQEDWYTAIGELIDNHDRRFSFIVVEKEYPHLVTIAHLGEDVLTRGHTMNRRALERYQAATELNSWPGYAQREVTIGLPRWMRPESELPATYDVF